VQLSADALVLDHYCHLVHDSTLGVALPQPPDRLADQVLGVSSGWLVAGLSQMSGPALAEAIMRAAGLRPLVPYPGSAAPWLCEPEPRGLEITPLFANVKRRGTACRKCAADKRGAVGKSEGSRSGSRDDCRRRVKNDPLASSED